VTSASGARGFGSTAGGSTIVERPNEQLLRLRLRLDAFLRATAATAQAALELAANGDKHAEHQVREAAGLLEHARALLDGDPAAARERLEQAETVMTDLAGYLIARQRELWPEQAAEAEREDEARFERLVRSAPAPVGARLRARRGLIAAATRRYDVQIVPVLLCRVRQAAREVRPRRQDGRGPAGDRAPPRRPSDPDGEDDVAPTAAAQ
jgi:hypothetical protein